MKFLIFVLVFGIFVESGLCDPAISSHELFDAFEEFKWKNKVVYKSRYDEISAFSKFTENYEFIKEKKEEYEHGSLTFQVDVNAMADQTDEEFAPLNGLLEETDFFSQRSDLPPIPVTNLTHLNYTAMGCVSPVKNQGRCGACYAFAVAAAIEGVCCLKNNKTLKKISEQQLVTCTNDDYYGNYGCRGGKMSNTFYYAMDDGLVTYDSFPYVALDNNTCNYNESNVVTRIQNFIRLGVVSEDDLKNVLAEIGPLALGINASSKGFQFYKSGVFYDANCTKTVNHAMALVGFGTDNVTGDYWLLKNFYGRNWGEYGYMRMARGKGNHCGFLSQIFYPICSY